MTARLIGINQLAAPAEQRHHDLRRSSIDPEREEQPARGPGPAPIHLPRHDIIIGGCSTEEEEASLGFLGQEQKAREGEEKLS